MNVLLTSIGRRFEIVELFNKALGRRGIVYTADADCTAPGLYAHGNGIVVPPVANSDYIDTLCTICREKKISLVIPFIDPELMVLARNKEQIEKETAATVLISDENVIETCSDKLLTAEFFEANGISVVETWIAQQYSWQGGALIAKPRYGSASAGIRRIYSKQEFDSIKLEPDYLVQPLLEGAEITIDLLCDFSGLLLAVVPRTRLKVRAGEVERGITIDAPELLSWAEKIVTALKPIGPLNIQCFQTAEGPVFTEINARFGGGYPLSYYAGVDFPQMIVDMVAGEKVKPQIGTYKRDLLLLRYDKAVVIEKKDLLQ